MTRAGVDTNTLLQTIGYPGSTPSEGIYSSKGLYDLARKNKVGSLYMQRLEAADAVGDLEDQAENRREYQADVTTAARAVADDFPDDLQYAVVKSSYDFPADSKDIDIVLFESDLDPLKQRLVDAGYEFAGDSPTTFDVEPPGTDIQIDVQTEFALQRVVYFDKETMRKGVAERPVNGVSLPVAAKPDDLALIVIHSITEQLFILKEFFAALYALEEFSPRELDRFFTTVEQNDIGPACRAFFTIVERLATAVYGRTPDHLETVLDRYPPYGFERRSFVAAGLETPYRYTRQTGLRSIAGKFRNPTFVRSGFSQVPRMIEPGRLTHIGSELLTRRERDHYVHDTSDIEG